MTGKRVLTKLLRFKELRITDFTFRRKALVIGVKPYKNGRLCPVCERRCKLVPRKTLPETRWWRDVTVCGLEVWLYYTLREIKCPTHGRITENIPWADAYARVTYRYEFLLLKFCQIMTQKAAARLLRVPSSTLSDQLHRTIKRIRTGHRIRALKTIGIDEVSFRKSHKYATLVYDLNRSRVVWVGKGKGRKTIDKFFKTMLSDYQKKQITLGCCDLSQTYIGAIQDHCPNATLVLDRFHIVKALNAAVDDVRKEQWRLANADERKALKGLRWLLYKHSDS